MFIEGIDREVIDYFDRTGELLPEIEGWNSDQIEELIDAIPNGNQKLVETLMILCALKCLSRGR